MTVHSLGQKGLQVGMTVGIMCRRGFDKRILRSMEVGIMYRREVCRSMTLNNVCRKCMLRM